MCAITPDEAEGIANMVRALADNISGARTLPIHETGECVRDGRKIVVTIAAGDLYPDFTTLEERFGDMRC